MESSVKTLKNLYILELKNYLIEFHPPFLCFAFHFIDGCLEKWIPNPNRDGVENAEKRLYWSLFLTLDLN